MGHTRNVITIKAPYEKVQAIALASLFLCFILILANLAYGQSPQNQTKLTANYDVCGGKEVGVEIKCSPDWKITSVPDRMLFLRISKDKPLVAVMISKDKTQNTLDSLNIPKKNPFGATSKVILAGHEAIKTEVNPLFLADHILSFYVVEKGYLYTIEFRVAPRDKWNEYSPIFDEMISSISFVK